MSETKTPRRIPFWLTLSLMANMLLVGLLGGVVLRSGPHRGGPDELMPPRPPVLGHASMADRQLIRKMMMESFASAEGELEARRSARENLGRALKLDPYAPEEVRAAFEQLRMSDEAVHAVTHNALVERLGELTGEQRKALAEVLSRDPGEDWRREHRKRKLERDRDPGPDRD